MNGYIYRGLLIILKSRFVTDVKAEVKMERNAEFGILEVPYIVRENELMRGHELGRHNAKNWTIPLEKTYHIVTYVFNHFNARVHRLSTNMGRKHNVVK